MYAILAGSQPVLSPRLSFTELDRSEHFCSSTRITWQDKNYLLTAGHCCENTVEARAEGAPVQVLAWEFGENQTDLCLLSAPPAATETLATIATSDAQPGAVLVGSGTTSGTAYQVFHCEALGALPKAPGESDLRASTCPSMPGYSGGGIWNLSGELVGVTSVRYGPHSRLGFVPLSFIRTFLLNSAR